MLNRIKSLTLNDKGYLSLTLYLSILLCVFILSCAVAQQENKSAWVWSVKAGDIMGLDPKLHSCVLYAKR